MFREATRDDLPAIVQLLVDDAIGAGREDGPEGGAVEPHYQAAFDAIAMDPSHILLVAEEGGMVAGCLQLSFIPGLSRRGALRAQIEGVRVAQSRRSSGLGQAMLGHAIALCRERGCALVQLTSDKRRTDALRFYERLGFEATHEGMKLALER